MTRTILRKLSCLRCSHSWWPRSTSRPSQCPGCHSARWDKPRVYAGSLSHAERDERIRAAAAAKKAKRDAASTD